jgi:hypothetical protein
MTITANEKRSICLRIGGVGHVALLAQLALRLGLALLSGKHGEEVRGLILLNVNNINVSLVHALRRNESSLIKESGGQGRPQAGCNTRFEHMVTFSSRSRGFVRTPMARYTPVTVMRSPGLARSTRSCTTDTADVLNGRQGRVSCQGQLGRTGASAPYLASEHGHRVRCFALWNLVGVLLHLHQLLVQEAGTVVHHLHAELGLASGV